MIYVATSLAHGQWYQVHYDKYFSSFAYLSEKNAKI